MNSIELEYDFPYINMSIEERDFCLRILNNCKEISNSVNKVNGVGKGTILKTAFRKDDDIIKADGPFFVGKDGIYENRWLNADIYIQKDSIVVDMLITRIVGNIEYRVADIFTIDNGKLKRESRYDSNIESIYENIQDDEMKGRLK